MKTRIELLQDLIQFKGDLTIIQYQLSQYPRDSEKALVVMDKAEFNSVLKSFFKGDISALALEEWANMIECREDIDFGDDKITEYISELAIRN